MAGSILKLSDVKLALNNAELNFKIQTSELNGSEDAITFIEESSKTKIRGKIVRSFNEGEMYHWPSLDHDNVARLIDILCIHDDLYIYLTIHNEVTLKNIVHDETFVYDTRCFDRKRSYAKGIFSGLSYLHGKSLALMNLCDDNIVISKTDDRAIITNFDHLTMQQKVTRSRLNIPEMYMAPETKKSHFDAIKAEIWASGILMLDVFLAHMVPWAIINYKPQKVIDIVNELSLDLLQAANAGSVVLASDLEKFQQFLKRFFFKQKPQERVPVKYAHIASFLQNRDLDLAKYKTSSYSHEIFPFLENTLPMDYASPNLPEEDMTIFLNPTYDPSTSCKSPMAQKREIVKVTSDASTNKTYQTNRSVQNCENKSLTGNLTPNIKVKKDNEFSLSSYYTNAIPIIDAEITAGVQKTAKSHEAVNAGAEDVIEPTYDYYQSESFSVLKPGGSSNNTVTIKQLSKENCCNVNSKLSAKQYVECDSQSSELGLNKLFNGNDVEFDNNTDDNAKCNLVVESGRINVQTGEKFSKILNARHMRIETQTKQRIPYNYQYNSSLQTSEKPIVKPPKNSKVLPFFLSSEVKSVINKIIFLRKCYISIQTHQKVFISKQFESRQRQLIKEYQALLIEENLQLREMLRKKNELKFEDITKLMRIVDFTACPSGKRNENLSVKQSIYENHQNRLPQPQETKDTIKVDVDNVKYNPIHNLKDKIIPNVRPNKNYSYHQAIENAELNQDRKWEIKSQLDSEISKNAWDKNDLVLENKVKRKLFPGTIKSDKIAETAKQDTQKKRNVKIIDKINFDCVTHPKESKITPPNKNYYTTIERAENNRKWEINDRMDSEKTNKAWERNDLIVEDKLKRGLVPAIIKRDRTTKEGQAVRKRNEVVKQDEQTEKNVKIVDKINYDCGARQKEPVKKSTKTKKKVLVLEINPKRDSVMIQQKTDKKEKKMQLDNCQTKLDEKTKKKEKKLSNDLKKLEEPKKSRFFSFMCPGGKVEKPIPIADTLCETCKLNLEIS